MKANLGDCRVLDTYRWLRQAGAAALLGAAFLLIPVIPSGEASAFNLGNQWVDLEQKSGGVRFLPKNVVVLDKSRTIEAESPIYGNWIWKQRAAFGSGTNHAVNKDDLFSGSGIVGVVRHLSGRAVLEETYAYELYKTGSFSDIFTGEIESSSPYAKIPPHINDLWKHVGAFYAGNVLGSLSGRFGGLPSDPPQSTVRDEKQAVEDSQRGSKDGDRIARPVVPIKLLGVIFFASICAGIVLFWGLARLQDRLL